VHAAELHMWGDLMPPRPPVAAGTRSFALTSATRGSHDGLAGRRRRCKQAEFRSSIFHACRLSQHKQGLPMGPESVPDIGGSGHSLRVRWGSLPQASNASTPAYQSTTITTRSDPLPICTPIGFFGSATGAVGTCYGAITSRSDPLQPATDLAHMHVLRDP
jgi:hypothetical protein